MAKWSAREEGGGRRAGKAANTLTLLVYRHHHGPVVRVDVEQRRRPHQVLRQVAQQRHRPANTINHIRTCFGLGRGTGRSPLTFRQLPGRGSWACGWW